jgi:hypothetical protein
MEMRRQWRIVTAGALVAGLGVAGAATLTDRSGAGLPGPIRLHDTAEAVTGSSPAEAELAAAVPADPSPESPDSPAESPMDSADSPFDSPGDPGVDPSPECRTPRAKAPMTRPRRQPLRPPQSVPLRRRRHPRHRRPALPTTLAALRRGAVPTARAEERGTPEGILERSIRRIVRRETGGSELLQPGPPRRLTQRASTRPCEPSLQVLCNTPPA